MILRFFKEYALMWGMLIGILLHPWVSKLAPYMQYSLFLMLLFSYTKIHPSELKITKTHLWMLLVQWPLGLLLYFVIAPFDLLIATGVSLIVLTPTATAAPVITFMLGGKIAFVTAYMIVSNLLIALVGPILISMINPELSGSYIDTVLQILTQVSALLILPLGIIWLLRFTWRKAHDFIGRGSKLTVYIWAFTVMVFSGKAVVTFKTDETMTLQYGILLALVTLVATFSLYFIGGRVAKWNGEDVVNGRQTFGQKNTVFAIWLAMSYLSPAVAIVPTLYIIWQNVINTLELSAYNKLQKQGKEL